MAEETDIGGAFGAIKSEKRYLSDRVDVNGQRRKVLEVSKRLNGLKSQLDRAQTGTPVYQEILAAYKRAVNDLDAEKTELNRIEAAARSDYRKAYKKETGFVSEREKARAEGAKKKTETLDQRIEVLQTQLKRATDAGENTVGIRTELQDLIDQRNQTGKYSPAPVAPEEGTAQAPQDINALLASAPDYLFNKLNDKKRKQLAQSLKDAGYNVPVTGTYNELLKNAYIQALMDNNQDNNDTKRNQGLPLFLVERARFVREMEGLEGAGGAGGAAGGASVNISTDSEAAGLIAAAFKANGFDTPPSPAQVASLTKALQKEEKKFSSVVRPVKRVRNGVEYTEYVGGLDRGQFLNELVQKLPEYNQRKQAERTLTVQDLAKTARANGLDLQKDFGDTVDNWVKRVESGEDIDLFKNMIRGTARLGMPERVAALMDEGMDLESIYAPYKRIMASTLEITPDSINLNDPTLRTAIGPEKEMSIYDFEKNLRKDNRWQYTNNAREEVADATLKVLRDFGFMG